MDKDYTELIQYLDEKFSKIDARFDKVDIRINQLVTAIDKLAKAVEDLRQEYSAIAAIIDKHDKWIHQLAEKLGVKLEF